MVLTGKEKISEEKARLHLEKLEEKLNYYKQVVINSSNAIIVQDFNGTVKAWNKGAERIYGFSEKEMLGKSITKIISKEYQNEARRNIEAIRKGKPTFLSSQVRKTKSHKEIFVKIVYSPIYEKEELIEIGTIEENVTPLKESMESLQKSETQFKELFNNMAECVAIYDVKNNGKDITIKDFNIAAEKLEKVKKEDIIGKKVDKVFKGVKTFGLYDVFKKVWKTGKPIHHPISFYKDKYHQGWRENFVFKLPHDGIAAIYSDVTERKEAEEKKYRTLYESSADAIMTLEPPSWKFISGNPATLRMFNLKNEKEFISRSPWDYSPKYQPDGQLSSIKARRMIAIAMKEGSNFFEWTHKKIGGENFLATVLLTKFIIGKNIFLQATVRDITKIKETEVKYRELFQNAIDAIFIADPKTRRLIDCNRTAEKLTGYSKEKILSMYAEELHSKDIQKETIEGFQKQVRGEIKTLLTEILTKDKKRIPVSINASLVKIGNKTFIQGIFRDLTEQRKMEEKAKESEIMKTEFLSAISHELRTPITPIKSQVQRMLDIDLDKSEQKDSLEIVLRNTLRIDRLIQDLLEISRIKAGKFKIFTKRINLNDLIQEVIADIDSLVKERNMTIIFDYGKIPEINLDKDRIIEVITNILDNALKYGKKNVLVKTKKEKRGILVEVKDDGIGISSNDAEKIFTPFYRGKSLEKGTGLGLSICKGIVEAHQGKIWFKSRINKGTSFFILFPSGKI